MLCCVVWQGSTDKVREHESTSQVSHLHLVLKAVQNFSTSTSTYNHTHTHPNSHPQSLPANLYSSGGGLLEVDGSEGGPGDGGGGQAEMSLAHSLREDQAAAAAAGAVDVGQRMDTLQERVRVFENIISVLSSEVEKAQRSMAELQRDHQGNQNNIRFLEAKVRRLKHRSERNISNSLNRGESSLQLPRCWIFGWICGKIFAETNFTSFKLLVNVGVCRKLKVVRKLCANYKKKMKCKAISGWIG